MSSKRSSVVWKLAKIDENNTEVVWCLIKDRDECNKPIRRGGTDPRKYSTGIVRRHFERHHPKELAKAEKELQEEKASKNKHISTFFETAASAQNLEFPLSPLTPLSSPISPPCSTPRSRSTSFSSTSTTSTGSTLPIPGNTSPLTDLAEPSCDVLEACASLKQQSLRESLQVKWGRDDLRSKAIDFKIGAMLALDNQLFSKVFY